MASGRVRVVDEAPIRPDGRYVLLWTIAARRCRWSHALDHALARARDLGRPLLVLEPLRVAYPWASERLHRFVVEGMRDQARRYREAGVTYLPYVEPRPDAGKGLLEALAADACCVITDDAPLMFLPRMVAAAGKRLAVRLEAVDGGGIVPLSSWDRTYTRAHDLRRALHARVLDALADAPGAEPLADYDLGRARVPAAVAARWPAADLDDLLAGGLARLPIDHDVDPVDTVGGAAAGEARLAAFVADGLDRYGDHAHPDDDATSGLSPWLHFGHVSAHEVVVAVLARDGWTEDLVDPRHTGEREGFWGASPEVEAFLDELITWRELAWLDAWRRPDLHARYEGNPAWARATLAEHTHDPRPHAYTRRSLEAARTSDPVWNAAQRQLLREGRIHGYLRMLWGKEVLAWTRSPEAAWDVLVALNDRWALDGRDPASYANIGWIFGRFDRAWGPERPIYGKVRYMTSASTVRKLRLRRWLERFGDGSSTT